ncbi:MAG TPA: hypothetical protein VGP07_12675 [Polyangia bacterium]|jgi:hypothetical protein
MKATLCPFVSTVTAARRASSLLIVALVAVASSRAGAAPEIDDPAASAEPPQRHFGVGPSVGFLAGNGVTMGGGGGFLRGWFTGGFAPIFVFANARTPDRSVRFNYYNAFQINEDLTFRIFQRPRLEGAVLVGYKYNTVLGSGGGGGFSVLYDLDRRWGLLMSVGVAVFPSAKARLMRNEGYPADREPPITPAIQGGANVGLVFFP